MSPVLFIETFMIFVQIQDSEANHPEVMRHLESIISSLSSTVRMSSTASIGHDDYERSRIQQNHHAIRHTLSQLFQTLPHLMMTMMTSTNSANNPNTVQSSSMMPCWLTEWSNIKNKQTIFHYDVQVIFISDHHNNSFNSSLSPSLYQFVYVIACIKKMIMPIHFLHWLVPYSLHFLNTNYHHYFLFSHH